ncbi:hypothetical protein PGTUg99_021951 [Puccinia graminis f. sp. tritici]|uniref:Uncharacterized protein n=1 Tax=Puccinia graminis f. sp. tritici TaxID=56615 RepID=A0A5B0NYS3_PUCGR|nr:hypothetical protein PGTUg99_021951 [Puccinia graminis f. sp. tritici]
MPGGSTRPEPRSNRRALAYSMSPARKEECRRNVDPAGPRVAQSIMQAQKRPQKTLAISLLRETPRWRKDPTLDTAKLQPSYVMVWKQEWISDQTTLHVGRSFPVRGEASRRALEAARTLLSLRSDMMLTSSRRRLELIVGEFTLDAVIAPNSAGYHPAYSTACIRLWLIDRFVQFA